MEDIVSKLGSEFANANYLSIPEVALLLQTLKQQGEAGGPHSNFEKFLTYCKRFNRFPNSEVAVQVRKLLEDHEFPDLEIALLSNLCPNNAEEARSLIPSLQRIENDDELNNVLDELARLKNLCSS